MLDESIRPQYRPSISQGPQSQVKICGHHQEEDVHSIVPLLEHVDYVGFIFTPISSRCVEVEQVVKWFQEHPRLRPKAVAVFLDQPLTEVKKILEQTGIAHAQLHGTESPVYCRELKEQVRQRTNQNQNKQADKETEGETLGDDIVDKVLDDESHANDVLEKVSLEDSEVFNNETNRNSVKMNEQLTIWKVIPINEQKTLPIRPYLPYVDGILLDTRVRGQTGGTGTRFDWSLIPSIQAELTPTIPLMIAGGINPNNVRELVQTYSVQGIDVSSGVEIDGQKDSEQIAALLKGVGKDA